MEIRPSALPGSGLGLFTRAPIPKGRFVCLYAGEILEAKEAKQRWTDRRSAQLGNYVLVLREVTARGLALKTVVDPTHRGNVG